MTEKLPDQDDDGGKLMPLWDHLHELRTALIRSILVVLAIFCVALFFANDLINFLNAPLLAVLPMGQKTIHFTGPMDVFSASLKVSVLVALVLGCPAWSYQFWNFLAPALYPNEKKYILPFAVASIALFFTGIIFCYLVMLPMTLSFLIGLGLEVGTPMITINDYISLVTVLMLAFGLVFETPLIMILLAFLEIIDYEMLSKHRSAAIMIILIVAAVLTPPDPFSQIAMAVPMYLLFEGATLIIWLMGRSKKKKELTIKK